MICWGRGAVLSALVTIVSAGIGTAGTVNLGYISFDVTQPGSTAQFDIVNETGPNASIFPDTTFPVTTSISLSDLSLAVHFTDGTTEDLGSSYFTLGLDGLSFNGGVIAIGGTNPLPDSATLTGKLSPTTVTLNDGSTVTLNGTFNAAVIPTRSGGLSDGDFAIITAGTGGGPPPTVPEPSTFVLLAVPLGGIVVLRKRWLTKARSSRNLALLAVCAAVVAGNAYGVVTPTVRLNKATSPDNGVAGVNSVNVTGQGFPSGTITPANIVVTFATSCGGTVKSTTSASSIKTIIGSTRRVAVVIPGTLDTGNYFVALSDNTAGDAEFTSSNCSEVKVTHTNTALSACLPTSSLGVLVPSKAGTVTAYVPNGAWSFGSTGIQVVNIEGPTSATSVSTTNVVNSCSSNPATNQTVCVANNTDVYLLTGTTLNKTLTSGASATTGFSGGSCENCGVAINALTNKAVINMGISGSPSGSGIQMLNLATNTFEAPIPLQNEVSEDISIDPTRNLILSPNERGIYDLLQIQSNGSSVKEFENNQNANGIFNFDSAAEDCSTGIGLASEEQFPFAVFVTDLTQAKLTAGSPGTWTAPATNFVITTTYSFSAATDGIAAASGTSHLAIITGEFGGNTFAVLKLPSTSGSGTPTVLDYAVAQVPSSTTCGGVFSAGFDPHTVTAYTSPNDGKAYGLMANGGATCLVRLDLAAILAAPRGGSGLDANDISAANFPSGAATFYSTH
jgi:hypothetical protein